MNENIEEQWSNVYYDAAITRIATRAEIVERDHRPNVRKWWMSRFFSDPSRLKMLESDEWCADNHESTITLSVEDNGKDGDGLRLSVRLTGTGKSLDEKDDGDLVVIDLAPRQAMVLARALEGVVRMRDGTG